MMMKMNLLVLPFAGGNRYSLQMLKKALPADIEFSAIELPGRGNRMNEPLLTNAMALADDIHKQSERLFDKPFAILGHCMGALLGFLLARRCISEGRAPEHLFFCGCSAPSLIFRNRLNAENVTESKELLQSFGVAPELLNNKSFLEMMMPILYSDITAYNGYVYHKEVALPVPMTVIVEQDSCLSADDAKCWQEETIYPISVLEIPGKLYKYYHEVAAAIESSNKLMAADKSNS